MHPGRPETVHHEHPRARGYLVARLKGGLGNQLFQYAVARILANRLKRELILDEARLVRPRATPRPYYLSAFSIDATRKPLAEVVVGHRITETLGQTGRGYDDLVERFSPVAQVAIVSGYWQSYRYLMGSEALIRQHLKVDASDVSTDPIYLQIKHGDSVGVHVRRGDYTQIQGSHFHSLGTEYYSQAVDWMALNRPNAHYYIFSDDILWCRANLRLTRPHTFVEPPSATSDPTLWHFKLMTACRHQIIANSTYSWWAAWLAASADQLVAAPQYWLCNQPTDELDILPPHWTRL